MRLTDRFIESYVHNGSIGVLVEFGVSCAIVLDTDAFKRLAKEVAMQVAAMAPASVEDLMRQPFIKDGDCAVHRLIAGVARPLDERIVVLRFIRWTIDERTPDTPEPPRAPAALHDLRGAG